MLFIVQGYFLVALPDGKFGLSPAPIIDCWFRIEVDSSGMVVTYRNIKYGTYLYRNNDGSIAHGMPENGITPSEMSKYMWFRINNFGSPGCPSGVLASKATRTRHVNGEESTMDIEIFIRNWSEHHTSPAQQSIPVISDKGKEEETDIVEIVPQETTENVVIDNIVINQINMSEVLYHFQTSGFFAVPSAFDTIIENLTSIIPKGFYKLYNSISDDQTPLLECIKNELISSIVHYIIGSPPLVYRVWSLRLNGGSDGIEQSLSDFRTEGTVMTCINLQELTDTVYYEITTPQESIRTQAHSPGTTFFINNVNVNVNVGSGEELFLLVVEYTGKGNPSIDNQPTFESIPQELQEKFPQLRRIMSAVEQ